MKRSTPFTGGLGCPAWLTSCSLTWPLHLFGQIASNISFNGKIVGNWICLTESFFSTTCKIFVNICEHSIHCTMCTLDSFSPSTKRGWTYRTISQLSYICPNSLGQGKIDKIWFLWVSNSKCNFPQIFPNYSPNSNGVFSATTGVFVGVFEPGREKTIHTIQWLVNTLSTG